MNERPRPRLRRSEGEVFEIMRGGFWLTADERFCVMALRPRGHWKLAAWHRSPTAEADDTFLRRYRIRYEQVSFPTRREALDALALALAEGQE